jgi:hypothetical protein
MVSSSNNISANAFANSVLPTPVVPRKMNEPIGRFGHPAYLHGFCVLHLKQL